MSDGSSWRFYSSRASDSAGASANSASSREGHLSCEKARGIISEGKVEHLVFLAHAKQTRTVPVVGKVCALQFSVELDGGVHRLDSVAGQHQALDVGVERDGDDVEVGGARARGRPQGFVARAGVRTKATCGGGQKTDHDDGGRGRRCRRGLPGRAHASAPPDGRWLREFASRHRCWLSRHIVSCLFFSTPLGVLSQFVLMPTLEMKSLWTLTLPPFGCDGRFIFGSLVFPFSRGERASEPSSIG